MNMPYFWYDRFPRFTEIAFILGDTSFGPVARWISPRRVGCVLGGMLSRGWLKTLGIETGEPIDFPLHTNSRNPLARYEISARAVPVNFRSVAPGGQFVDQCPVRTNLDW
jgi:hypothetical protein